MEKQIKIDFVERTSDEFQKIINNRKEAAYPDRTTAKEGIYTLLPKFAIFKETYRGRQITIICCAALPKGKADKEENYDLVQLGDLCGKERQFAVWGSEDFQQIDNLLPFDPNRKAWERDDDVAKIVEQKPRVEIKRLRGHFEVLSGQPTRLLTLTTVIRL